MRQWFYIHPGIEVTGPKSDKEMVRLRRKGEIDPLKTFVWHSGMKNWVHFRESELDPDALVGLLAKDPPPPVPEPDVKEQERPEVVAVEAARRVSYGGPGRLTVWLGPVISVLAALVVFWAGLRLIDPSLIVHDSAPGLAGWVMVLTSSLLLIVIPLLLRFQRLKNLGMWRWMIMLELVPVANLWLWWRCYCCPEGYHVKRKLDRAGKILTALFFAPWTLAIALACIRLVGK